MRIIISASNFGLSGVVSVAYNLTRFLIVNREHEMIVVGESREHYFEEFKRMHIPCVILEGVNLVKALKLYALIHFWQPQVFVPGFSDYEYIFLHRVPQSVKLVQPVHSDHVDWYAKFRHVSLFADGFIFVSRFLQRQLGGQHHGVEAFIPNFVDTSADLTADVPDRFSDPVLHILYTGRLVQKAKRVFDFPEILQGIPRVRLHIAGDGQERPELLARLTACGVQHTYHGLLGPRALADLYRQCSLFLLTSAYEGLPLSLLEAMSYGCVPLVSRVSSGVPDVVDEYTGYLVPVGDIVGFRTVIGDIMPNRETLRRKSKASAERVARDYSSTHCGPQYEALFKRVQQYPSRHPVGIWRPRVLPGTSLFSDS